MEIKVCIAMKAPHEKYPRYVRETITEDDLFEWAKRYVSDNYSDDKEATSIEVESVNL